MNDFELCFIDDIFLSKAIAEEKRFKAICDYLNTSKLSTKNSNIKKLDKKIYEMIKVDYEYKDLDKTFYKTLRKAMYFSEMVLKVKTFETAVSYKTSSYLIKIDELDFSNDEQSFTSIMRTIEPSKRYDFLENYFLNIDSKEVLNNYDNLDQNSKQVLENILSKTKNVDFDTLIDFCKEDMTRIEFLIHNKHFVYLVLLKNDVELYKDVLKYSFNSDANIDIYNKLSDVDKVLMLRNEEFFLYKNPKKTIDINDSNFIKNAEHPFDLMLKSFSEEKDNEIDIKLIYLIEQYIRFSKDQELINKLETIFMSKERYYFDKEKLKVLPIKDFSIFDEGYTPDMYEVIFSLQKLDIPNYKKLSIFKSYMKINRLNTHDFNDVYVFGKKNFLKDLKKIKKGNLEVDAYNNLVLAKSLGIDLTYVYDNLDKVLHVIYANKDTRLNKHSIAFLLEILGTKALGELDLDTQISFLDAKHPHFKTKYENLTSIGKHSPSSNEIILNLGFVPTQFNRGKEIIDALYHEIEHARQEKLMESEESFFALKLVASHIICPQTIDQNEMKENYYKKPREKLARMYGDFKRFELSFNLARKKPLNNNVMGVESPKQDVCLDYVENDIILSYIKQLPSTNQIDKSDLERYPSLKIAFHEDGTAKEEFELVEDYVLSGFDEEIESYIYEVLKYEKNLGMESARDINYLVLFLSGILVYKDKVSELIKKILKSYEDYELDEIEKHFMFETLLSTLSEFFDTEINGVTNMKEVYEAVSSRKAKVKKLV